MKRYLLHSLLAAALGACVQTAGADRALTEPLPEVHVAEVSRSPLLDGVLSESCWQGTPGMRTFHVFPPDGTRSGSTSAWLVHDARYLYVGVRCVNPTLDHLGQQVFERDGSVVKDDSVEVFLGPGGHDTVWYYQFILSFANVQADRLKPRRGRKIAGWDAPWQSATARTEEGWSCEVAIPLCLLADGADLANLRINVTRNLHEAVLDTMGAKIDERCRQSTWAPMQRSFNESHHLGFVRGLSNEMVEDAFLPLIVRAAVGPYTRENGACLYTVKLGIKAYGRKRGRVRVRVVDAPGKGEPGSTIEDFRLAGDGVDEVSLKVPVANVDAREVSVHLLEPGTDRLLQEWKIRDTSVLSLVSDPLPDRTYYTTEDKAAIRCRLQATERLLDELKLRVTGPDGGTLAVTGSASRVTTLDLPLEALPVGTHPLVLKVENRRGELLAQRTVTLVKRTPNPGREVKVDRFRGVVFKNGRPFFCFGIITEADAGDDDAFRRIADAGFNTVVHWKRSWSMPEDYAEESRQWIDAAARHGLQAIELGDRGRGFFTPYVQVRGRLGPKREQQLREALEAAAPAHAQTIEAVKSCTNLLAYANVDEPNLGNGDALLAGSEFFRRRLNVLDGYRPVWALYARTIPAGTRAVDIADILLYDIYMIKAHGRSVHAEPNCMSRLVPELRQRADRHGKAAWVVPVAEGLDPKRSPRILTRGEQRCQTYLALIHGARGIVYFVDSRMYAAESWDTLSELGREMKLVGPAVTAPGIPQTVRYEPGAFDPANERFPDVQVRLCSSPRGTHLLLAANSRPYPVETVFTFPALDTTGPVKDVFGRSTCEVHGSSFHDTFPAYAVRVYELAVDVPPGGSAAIGVRTTGFPQRGEPQKVFGLGAQIAERKNIMANPSFEETTIPGLPDYHQPLYYGGFPKVGRPGASWGLDSETPREGENCLRIAVKRGDGGRLLGYRSVGVCYPPANPESPYVLSLYMRAGEPGTRVFVVVQDWKETGSPYRPQKTFVLTREWRRYSVSGTFEPWDNPWKRARNVYVGIDVRDLAEGREPIVWIDGLQVETGRQPTAFTRQ